MAAVELGGEIQMPRIGVTGCAVADNTTPAASAVTATAHR